MSQTTGTRPPGRKMDTARLEEKKRLRRKKRIQRKIITVVLVAVLCAGSFAAGRCTAPKSEAGKSEKNTVVRLSRTVETSESALSDEEKRNYILTHPEIYPEFLRAFLENSPEALDFVYSYPDCKNIDAEIQLTDDYEKGKIPHFLQWDKRWGYAEYGDDLIALSGCGPTCLSMVYVGLTGDTSMNPKAMAVFSEENGFYLENVGTSWELMSTGACELGLKYETLTLREDILNEELDLGHPLICSMSPGDFTASGHFIVIYGYDKNGFYVCDPNSLLRSEKQWPYSVLKTQIKNIWAYSR